MTYVLGFAKAGVADVTRRYVKDFSKIKKRRNKEDEESLARLIERENQKLRSKFSLEIVNVFISRDKLEERDLWRDKELKDSEKEERQSGSEDWRKQRGELSK